MSASYSQRQMLVDFTHEASIMSKIFHFLPMTKMSLEENRQKSPMSKASCIEIAQNLYMTNPTCIENRTFLYMIQTKLESNGLTQF